MLGFKNQVIGNYGMMVHVYFHNCDLLFPVFAGSLFSIKHFQAKANGNIFCSSEHIFFWLQGKILVLSKGEK